MLLDLTVRVRMFGVSALVRCIVHGKDSGTSSDVGGPDGHLGQRLYVKAKGLISGELQPMLGADATLSLSFVLSLASVCFVRS